MKKVGIIGIGVMGKVILKKYLEEGYQVYIYDLVPEVVAEAVEMGAAALESPSLMPAETDIILTVLPGPPQVKGVFSSLIGQCREENIIVDLSTVDPATSRGNYQTARENGVSYLDAPILGRPHKCGHWTLPVGGDEDVFKTVKDVLQVIADKVLYMGGSGNGNALKLLNNLMFGVINTVTTEIMALAEKVGMDPGVFYETVANSGAATVSNLFVELGPKIVNREFSANFTTENLHKDMRLGIEMSKDAGMPLFVTEVCQKVIEIGLVKGLNREDSSSLVKVYEDLTRKLGD